MISSKAGQKCRSLSDFAPQSCSPVDVEAVGLAERSVAFGEVMQAARRLNRPFTYVELLGEMGGDWVGLRVELYIHALEKEGKIRTCDGGKYVVV